MADTLTTFMSLVKQTIGGNRNTWGNILNDNMDLIDTGIAGLHPVATLGGTTTLADTEWVHRIINVTGSLASNATIIFPNRSGFWIVRNATTGGSFTVTCKTTSGTGVVVIRGGHTIIWCDGNNGMYVGASSAFLTDQIRAPDGTLAAPGISWANELTSGIYRYASGAFGWACNGLDTLYVEAVGFWVYINSVQRVHVDAIGTYLFGKLAHNNVTGTVVPVGAEVDFPGITPPNGWLFEAGQTLSRVTYSELLEALTATATATRNGTTTLSAVSRDLTWLGLEGAKVEGTGITTGTTITAVTASTITLSIAASGSGATTIRIFPTGTGVGDGSTTFQIPYANGTVNAARDNMGGFNYGWITGLTMNGRVLGNQGGNEIHTLTVAQVPALTYSGTSSDISANHYHAFSWSGTTSGFNTNHSHHYGWGGTTSGQSADHTHTVSDSGYFSTAHQASPGGGSVAGNQSTQNLSVGGSSNDHSHTYSGEADTGGANVDHSHTYSGSSNTGFVSGGHTHTYSGSTSGGGGTHNNIQPTRIVNRIIFTNVFV